MKIAIIGAAGVRTPQIIKAITKRQEKLELSELALMDIDGERLELIGALTAPLEHSAETHFHITRTTDPELALKDADFVITTFRVGGIESRVIDERVPLEHAVLGQETTGPGGFAMGIRSIPVLLSYVSLMQEICPHAWLINFANPAGMLTEAVVRQSGWQRVVGICDGPATMHAFISAFLGAKPDDVFLDYFGLNHLGWVKGIVYHQQDHLPALLDLIRSTHSVPGLPFDPDLVLGLQMLPNEYCYYYYDYTQAVNNILKAGESRGEQIARENLRLFAELKHMHIAHDETGMLAAYQSYMDNRSHTYMVAETGGTHALPPLDPIITASIIDEGYAGVALNLIEALLGEKPSLQILNVANQGAIATMDTLDVVEVPVLVSQGQVRPLEVSEIPSHCLGLMQQVKHYEHLTIEAAVENSYQKALLALAIHPLVRDFSTARSILDEYIFRHKGYFPELH
jgi:alpha-galactosidase/6-phospho-beta-glucosidase family protein